MMLNKKRRRGMIDDGIVAVIILVLIMLVAGFVAHSLNVETKQREANGNAVGTEAFHFDTSRHGFYAKHLSIKLDRIEKKLDDLSKKVRDR